MRKFFPKTLRYQMLLLILMIVSVPILLIGYTVKIQAEKALLQEKQIKLSGIARLLDHHLGNDFDTILSERHMLDEKRSDKIKALNERLALYRHRCSC